MSEPVRVADADTEAFRDFAKDDPIASEALDFERVFRGQPRTPSPEGRVAPRMPTAHRVRMADVLGPGHDFKVRQDVVPLLSVFVVDLESGRDGAVRVNPHEPMGRNTVGSPVDPEHNPQVAVPAGRLGPSSGDPLEPAACALSVSPNTPIPVNRQDPIGNQTEGVLRRGLVVAVHAATIPYNNGNMPVEKESEWWQYAHRSRGFGGKSRVANLIWERFGDVPNFVEPFFGSGAVLLGRPTQPGTETVNDLDCIAPPTRVLMSDMTWQSAAGIRTGDKLIGFDEGNGPARQGLRAPTRYRRFAVATVTGVRRLARPSYRLTFDDGTTVVASDNHLWLGGSHASGGRGWRWVATKNMVCDRKTQRSWVLKVCDVIEREDSFDAGWLSGLLDGEGSLVIGPGLRASLAQNEGPVLERAAALLVERGISAQTRGKRRCRSLVATGGKHEQLALLMRFRPMRLIGKFAKECEKVSLYGRAHRAVGLVKKEFLGDQEVVAIETDTRTFIAEGLASHNCYIANFWRAVQAAPDAVAAHADWPVNEADLHARHLWLVRQEEFRERMKVEPEFFDVRIAGWWVWGLSSWIGRGWCTVQERPWRQLPHLTSAGQGINRTWQQLPSLDRPRGVNARRIDDLSAYFDEIRTRMRGVRVACGDWTRVLGDSVTHRHGLTGVFLDPPYDDGAITYGAGGTGISAAVREWAVANGEDQALRIALCGYEGEHEMPDSWACVPWKARGGYGSQGNGDGRENAARERIWFSPACLVPGRGGHYDLFEEPLS